MHGPETIDAIAPVEKEPVPFATIFIVRHGDTEYKEERVDPDTENDLTDVGTIQIRELAERIDAEIGDGDTVYIMSSPRARTESTARILKETIGELGHNVVALEGGKTSLRNFKLVDEEGRDIYTKKHDKEEYLSDMEKIFERLEQESDYYLKYRAGTVEHSHTQNLEEYKKKIQTFLRRIIEISRERSRDNEKLILTTHGEWLDSVLELYLSRKIEKLEDSASKGEAIKMEVFSDKLKFYFRGQEAVVEA